MKYLGYIKNTAVTILISHLDTEDLHTASFRIWPDADLAGDAAEDCQSSGGYWVELASQCGARSWALHWSYSKQGFTAGHTQEAEIVAMYDALRNDGLPIAMLLEFLFGRLIVVEVPEDNAAAIVAAEAGYGPRVRHLHRTKRVHASYLCEVFNNEIRKLIFLKWNFQSRRGI